MKKTGKLNFSIKICDSGDDRKTMKKIMALLTCMMIYSSFSVVFCQYEDTRQAGLLWQGVTFNQWNPGQSYSYTKSHEDFGEYPNFFNSPLLSLNAYLADWSGMGTCMRVRYREGLYSDTGSGAIWRAEFSSSHREMVLDFDGLFEDGFEFVRGGKFHGLCSKNCYSGGDSVPGDGMSARFMWRGADDLNRARIVLYVYHTDMPGIYGQDLPLLHGGPDATILPNSDLYFPSIDQTFHIGYEDRDFVGPWPVIRIEDGTWYHYKLRIRLNDAGQRNGAIQVWLNGELVLNVSGFNFGIAGTSTSEYYLKYFLFQTFHGGGDTSWAPSSDVYAYFDNFQVQDQDCQQVLEGLLTHWNQDVNMLTLVSTYPTLFWTCQ